MTFESYVCLMLNALFRKKVGYGIRGTTSHIVRDIRNRLQANAVSAAGGMTPLSPIAPGRAPLMRTFKPRGGGKTTAVGEANAEGVNVTHGKTIKYT